jgi:hypothetical protein
MTVPLLSSLSKQAISQNIRTEKNAHPGMSLKQAIAIAYNVKRPKKKEVRK